MNNNNAINREVKPETAPNSSATPPAFTSKESGQNVNQICVSNTHMKYLIAGCGINAFIASLFPGFPSSALAGLYWGMCYFFIFKDKKLMEENGFASPSLWWFLIPIVYLWKRATILKTKRTLFFMYFLVSILASIVGVILKFLVALLALYQNL